MGRGDAGTRAASAGVQRTGRPKARPARAGDFTEAKRQLFLDAMAATANAQEAARIAGVNVTTAYRLRHLAPEFAAAWDRALDIGYCRLEEQLLARALEAVEAIVIDPTAVAAPPLPPLADACGLAGTGGAGTGGIGDDEPATGARRSGGSATGWAARGLPPAYQLALAPLDRRNGLMRGNGSRRPGGARKPMSGDEITAVLIERLDMAAAIADRVVVQAQAQAEAPGAAALPGPSALRLPASTGTLPEPGR